MTLQTIILAGGFQEIAIGNNKSVDKFSLDFLGKPLFEHIINAYSNGPDTRLILIADNTSEYIPNSALAKKVLVPRNKGAIATALIGANGLELSEPIILCPSDALIPKNEYRKFLEQVQSDNPDLGAIVFKSANPKYSYVRKHQKKVIEIREKIIISSLATAGVFYFKSLQYLIESAEWLIINNFKTRGLFYVAPALNYGLTNGASFSFHEINESEYLRFSSETEYLDSIERISSEYS
jgi:dTDP-glucose pyrophosphorylase